jgi:hypothetical protein
MAEPQDVGTESYEDIRASAPEKVRNAWNKADRVEDAMRIQFDQIAGDSRHSDEYKRELSWGAYDKLGPQVLEAREEAREQLEKSARMSRIQSLPFPPGEGPRTTDTSKLLLSQSEYQRTSRKLDRIEKRPGPMRTSVLDVLRSEWAEALEKGETEEASICRGILSVIDEYGFDVDDVVDPFRRVRHRNSLEYAERSEAMLGHLPHKAKLPEPDMPRPRPRSLRAEEEKPEKRKTNAFDRRTNKIVKAGSGHVS